MSQTDLYMLLPRERRIWTKFRTLSPIPLDTEQFNVRLGEGAVIPAAVPAWLKRDIKALTRKRADVIVESGNEIWLFEIKPRAGFSALGQLLGYATLYVAEYDPVRPPHLAVVAERSQPDLATVLANFGISLFLVGSVS